MEEKDLLELERALQAANPSLPWQTLPDWSPYDRLKVAAVNALPSLISDIREARRLLGEARLTVAGGIGTHGEECRAQRAGEGDCEALTNMRATLKALDAFLGERSDRERSSPPSSSSVEDLK